MTKPTCSTPETDAHIERMLQEIEQFSAGAGYLVVPGSSLHRRIQHTVASDPNERELTTMSCALGPEHSVHPFR